MIKMDHNERVEIIMNNLAEIFLDDLRTRNLVGQNGYCPLLRGDMPKAFVQYIGNTPRNAGAFTKLAIFWNAYAVKFPGRVNDIVVWDSDGVPRIRSIEFYLNIKESV